MLIGRDAFASCTTRTRYTPPPEVRLRRIASSARCRIDDAALVLRRAGTAVLRWQESCREDVSFTFYRAAPWLILRANVVATSHRKGLFIWEDDESACQITCRIRIKLCAGKTNSRRRGLWMIGSDVRWKATGKTKFHTHSSFAWEFLRWFRNKTQTVEFKKNYLKLPE